MARQVREHLGFVPTGFWIGLLLVLLLVAMVMLFKPTVVTDYEAGPQFDGPWVAEPTPPARPDRRP